MDALSPLAQEQVLRLLCEPAGPHNSLNPRLATAGTVSRAGATTTIVAVPAYSTCLRSRG